MILLVILVILAALVLFAVWPGAKREDLRAPFYGRNYAHRGYFGKDQRPPENSLPAFALNWTYSLRLTISWWFSTMIRWTA